MCIRANRYIDLMLKGLGRHVDLALEKLSPSFNILEIISHEFQCSCCCISSAFYLQHPATVGTKIFCFIFRYIGNLPCIHAFSSPETVIACVNESMLILMP